MPDRVTLVCSNNGKNCLGRALLLGDLLTQSFDVNVVGIQTTEHSWGPGASFGVPMRSLRISSALEYPSAVAWLRRQMAGSRVVVCKPKPTSLGLALAAGIRPDRAILDVDDWDVGFGDAPSSPSELVRRSPYYVRSLLHPKRLNSYLGVRSAFALIGAFPNRLVSNGWLKRRVGGHLLPHVRDAARFAPAAFDAGALRQELGLASRPWVGFIGTVRPHKGIEDLVAALATSSGDKAPGLLLAGIDPDDLGSQRELLRFASDSLGPSRLHIEPRFPFSELPRWLSIPDVLCIPSRPGATSAGQIPAKMFDALMMGKPLVISDAHDSSDVAPDALVRFRAGDVPDLARKLTELCANAELRASMSKRARVEALSSFDYDAGRRILVPLVQRLHPR